MADRQGRLANRRADPSVTRNCAAPRRQAGERLRRRPASGNVVETGEQTVGDPHAQVMSDVDRECEAGEPVGTVPAA